MKILYYIIAAMLLLTSCHKEEDNTRSYTPGRRTIIAYMVGENNLSPYVQSDINEMIVASKTMPEDCRLVIYVDRSSTIEPPFIAQLNGRKEHPVDTLYKFPGDIYSCDAEEFRNVLSRAISLCPSQEYGLILWGHANGWIIETEHAAYSGRRAYGLDNGRNTNSLTRDYWMNIPSMAKALKDLGINWKFIFSDCCNMQGVEVAYELRNLAEYLIASPAEITGNGAPYDQVILDLCKADDQLMYKSVCDDYNAQYDFVGGHLPISVVNTAKIEGLLQATRNILPTINAYTLQSGAMNEKIYYYTFILGKDAEKILYDMNDVIMSALDGQDSLYSVWKEAFDEAIVYKKTSNFWHTNSVNLNDFNTTENFAQRQGVINMFFPLDKYNLLTHHSYNQAIKQMEWYQAVGWSTVGW